MAAPVRRSQRPLADLLLEEPYRFDFYKAVQIIEQQAPGAVPVGQGAEPEREAVRFSADVSLAFPASDVRSVTAPEAPGEPAVMETTFLGLAGVHGPLPNVVTEVVLQRQHKKDRAFRAFLDIFNHRLLSLQYRVRRQTRLAVRNEAPENTHFARYLLAFLGLGTPYLRDRMGVPDRALLPFAGLLAGRARSAPGLETMLSEYFGVPVRVTPFAGRWLVLEPDERTAIGTRLGANNDLGGGAVLGGRVWDVQGTFLLRMGPLTFERFVEFLPVGRAHAPAVALTRYYTGEHLDFDFILMLRAEDVPVARLGSPTAGGQGGSYLGWTSWLRRAPGSRAPGIVRLASRHHGGQRGRSADTNQERGERAP